MCRQRPRRTRRSSPNGWTSGRRAKCVPSPIPRRMRATCACTPRPPAFLAWVEVYVGGRWYLCEPSGTAIPMGSIRLASGRDAADAAFASIFGGVEWQAALVEIEAIEGADGIRRLPAWFEHALS